MLEAAGAKVAGSVSKKTDYCRGGARMRAASSRKPRNSAFPCSTKMVCASFGRSHRMIREILEMGDPRLLRIAQPVEHFDTPELHALVQDMFDTMRDANGAGSRAPQIGVTCRSCDLRIRLQRARTPTRRSCRKPC